MGGRCSCGSRCGKWDQCPTCAVSSERVRNLTLEAEVRRVRALIHRDRTGLAAAIDAMVKEAAGRLWVVEGRGSYEWNDDRYRKETGAALRAVIEIGKKALNESGNLADSAFHPERVSGETAR
jgi:hypothetical protein